MQLFNFDALLTKDEHLLRQALIEKIVKQPKTAPRFQPQYQFLLDKHVMTTNDQYITCLYPFATHKTQFKVELNQHNTVYAMCAIDAIGVHYTLNQPIKIEAQCAQTHTPIHLSVEDGTIKNRVPSNDIYVLYKNLYRDTPCASTCCPDMLFFVNEAALKTYYQSHIDQHQSIDDSTEYYALTLDEANQAAKDIFSIRPKN